MKKGFEKDLEKGLEKDFGKDFEKGFGKRPEAETGQEMWDGTYGLEMRDGSYGLQIWDGAYGSEMVEHMYRYVESAAASGQLEQTGRVLPLMRRLHEGQTRIGAEGEIPYIVHPLTIAYQCLALGLAEDELLAAALLHDVIEDCGAVLEELPVSEPVKRALDKLTFQIRQGENRPEAKARYYRGIPGNRIATIVKILDRCNNISTMSMCFSREKMLDYMEETRRYVLPLISQMEELYPECYNAAFLIKYHMLSVMESVNYLLSHRNI